MPAIYRNAGIGADATASAAQIEALQHDLRRLGYLAHGIDGRFGDGTRAAIRALQHDLLHNDGASTASDGQASVAVTSYNKAVRQVSGIMDEATCDSAESMLADERFTTLPRSDSPAADNLAVLRMLASKPGTVAPLPFLVAIFKQESRAEHYAVTTGSAAKDGYVTLGLDRNHADQDRITSRGYGLGQYTIFHHPPTDHELASFVQSPWGNVQKAAQMLRQKFDGFVLGRTADTRSEERLREHPLLSLRLCRYGPADARHMADCGRCASSLPRKDISPATPLYAGATATYGEAQHYSSVHYAGVPDRAGFLCDWPYAVRRYNGSGPDSYNYQARIMLNLLTVQPQNLGA